MSDNVCKPRVEWTDGCTDRINKLRDRFWGHFPTVDTERARIFTKTYKESEADDYIIKRAKALYNYFAEREINIWPDELIVGTYGNVPRAAIVIPEISWQWVEKELDTMATRPQDPYFVKEVDKKILREEIFPYWKGRAIQDYCYNNLDSTLKEMVTETNIMYCLHVDLGVGECVPTYGGALFEKGFKGLEEDAKSKLREINTHDPDAYSKSQFYKAVILCCQAAKVQSERYAAKAREMAAQEPEGQRKKDLLNIASMCDQVPYNPPRTFAEAVQFVWLSQILIWLEENGTAICIGRPDQYLYPFYKREKAAGTLTDEQAQEYIEALWIKMAEIVYFIPYESAEYYPGYQTFHGLTLGGTDSKGNNVCNELSKMMIQATIDLRMSSPSINVRTGKDSPDDYLEKIIDLVKLGTGQPAIYFDDTVVAINKYLGVTEPDARNWCIGGCIESQIPGKMHKWQEGGRYSYATAVEWALFDGYNKVYNMQYGIKTGDPRNFKTFDDFKDAVKKQLAYLISCIIRVCQVAEKAHHIRCPKPMQSTMTEGCIETGIDSMSGGAVYNIGPGLATTGIADLADSLMAVKKLVYDEKKITMDELIKALDNNFEGYEDIRQLLINGAPKYGNDEDEVDMFVAEFIDFSIDETEKFKNIIGCPYTTGIVPVIANLTHGTATWALPSGRKAKEALADGISPFSGYDKKGPTAVINSVCKTNHKRSAGGNLLNMKFSPQLFKTQADRENFKTLLKAMDSQGGYHVQFNVINREILEKAQKTPEKYSDLLVRVAGYSAYFVDLHKDVQDVIISRRFISLLRVKGERGGYHIQFNVINKDTLIDAQKHPENYGDLLVRVAGYSAYFVDLRRDAQDMVISRTEHASW